MINAPGNASASVAIDDPQFRQNLRESDLPLPPLCAKDTRPSPLKLTLDAGTTILTENAEPDTCWQSVQWQIALPRGSALLSYRTAPQRHLPEIFAIPTLHASCSAISVGGADPKASSALILTTPLFTPRQLQKRWHTSGEAT